MDLIPPQVEADILAISAMNGVIHDIIEDWNSKYEPKIIDSYSKIISGDPTTGPLQAKLFYLRVVTDVDALAKLIDIIVYQGFGIDVEMTERFKSYQQSLLIYEISQIPDVQVIHISNEVDT